MTETETIKVIVKCKDVEVCSDTARQMNGTIIHVHSSINALTISIPKDKLTDLKADPNTEYVEVTTPNDVHVLGFKSESDVTPDQLKAIASSQVIPWGVSKIRATDVQSGGNKGTGVRVCILDTGIDYNHEDLLGQMKVGHNFVTGSNDPLDDYGHSTHVAGTIAALDNNLGVLGVAPEAHLLIGKVLDNNGSGSYDWIVAGIQWAIDNKAQVISMSFGGGSFSQALQDICNAAKNAGIVLVAAAGNADGDGSQNTVGYPAKFDSVIAVAATDNNDKRASFSSAGNEVWVAAPGVNVLSTMLKSGPLSNQSGYGNLNGTSMATPHVSAMVALMLKANPNLTPDNIKTLLSTTSIDLGTPGKDIFFGYGRVDAVNAVGENPPPTKTYNCTGAPDFQCVEAPPGTTGKYLNLESCQAACKEPQPTPVLTAISITPTSATINVNTTISLSASCMDQSGNSMKCPNLTWVSDNTAIATVDNTGIITGIAVGNANITVSSSDIDSNRSAITVIAAPTPPPTPLPSKNKYMVIQSGNTGIVIIKNPIGKKTADEACAEACNMLKQIDKLED